MRAKTAGAGLRRLCLATLFLVLGIGVVVARADDPAKSDKGDKGDKPAEKAPMDKPVEKPREKKYAFIKTDTPWTQVLEWFAGLTDLTFVGPYKPTGTFNFIPPKGKEFTIGEIVDAINEALLVNAPTQQYILIRKSKTFTLVPADEQIPVDQVVNVDAKVLPTLGRTEVVRIDVPLKKNNAEDIAPIVKKTMSKFSQAIAIEGAANQLILIDTAASLEQVLKTIEKIEGDEQSSQSLTFQCVYTHARDAEKIIRDLFGEPKPTAEAAMDDGTGGGGRGGRGRGGDQGASKDN